MEDGAWALNKKPEELNMSNVELETKISDVDAAIAVAKVNKARRVVDPDRVVKKALEAAAREEKRVEATRIREERKAARANKQIHMAKVERAASLLPTMTERAEHLFNEITASLPRDQVSSLAAHLTHFNRVQATQSAATTSLTVGMQVRVIGGDNKKFIGMVGTVDKAQRIRCYVNVGSEKLVYLYNSDVEVVENAAAEAV